MSQTVDGILDKLALPILGLTFGVLQRISGDPCVPEAIVIAVAWVVVFS